MKNLANQLPCFTVAEWGTLHLKGRTLVPEDRILAARLAEGDCRFAIDELRDGLRFGAKSWVGVVRFHGFELHVVPKLVGDNLGLVELIDYAAGLDALDRHQSVRNFQEGGTSLFDLLALLLVESCERLLRNGLLSDYCEIEDDLPVVRGRMLLQKQLLKRFGIIDRLECRHDEYLTDILENRLLLAALSVCASRVVHPSVGLRVRRLLAIFLEVCELSDFDLRTARSTLTYHRMNEHYHEPHGLAWLVLDGLGIEDIYAAGDRHCFAFLLDMNRLFEAFIARWLRQTLSRSEYRVLPQSRDRTILWNADLVRPYASVIPDLLVENILNPGRFLPVDAKYKLFDERKIATGDIYQSFLYAFAYGEDHSIVPRAVVLYPASSMNGAQQRLQVRRKSGEVCAELRAMPIHIPTALREVRSRSLGVASSRLVDAVKIALDQKNSLEMPNKHIGDVRHGR